MESNDVNDPGQHPDALEYLSCGEAGRSLPINCDGRRKGVSAATAWRYMRYGVGIRGTGQRVYLRHTRIGSRLVTTRQWLADFLDQVAQADMDHFASKRPSASAEVPPDRWTRNGLG